MSGGAGNGAGAAAAGVAPRAEPEIPPSPGFDVAAMTAFLDGKHAGIRARIREILSREEFAPRPCLTREEYREQVWAWLERIAGEGWGFVGYPEEVGGGGDPAGGVAIFEALAFGDLSLVVKFGVQFGLFGGAIAQLGTEEHRREYLPRVARAELPGAFALTETGHGSNARDIRTTARYEPASSGFVVDTPDDDARKDYIGNAAVHGRMAAVFAQLEVAGEPRGVHVLLVPIRDAKGRPLPGVRIEDCGEKLGLNGVDNGRLWFSSVRVPRESLLGRFGTVDEYGTYRSPIADQSARFFTMLGALVQGRVSIAAAAVSASKSALAGAVGYGVRRRQFGPPGEPETPVLDYLTHQRRLMPLLATTYAMDAAVKHLVAEYARAMTAKRVSRKSRRQVESLAAGIKALATWHATETIQTCRECCGGAGYLAENRFAALKADTEVFTTFEGDNTVLLQLVAKGLLTNYRSEFGDIDVLRTIRFVATRVVESIAEAVPTGVMEDVMAVIRRSPDDDEAVRNRDFHLGAFAFRERHLLEGLARRIRKEAAESDAYRAVAAVQDHMVATAAAHAERVVLERFAAAAESAGGRGVAETLGTLCDLYALSRIERDRGWFLEHGFLSATRSKAVVRAVGRLSREVRPLAQDLVDAFAVPGQWLPPIASR